MGADPLGVRAIVDHVAYGRDGSAWACFEVEPFAYPHRPISDAQEAHARTRAALLGLAGDAVVLSLVHPTNETSRVAAPEQVDGASMGLWERMWVLGVRLPDSTSPGGMVDRVGSWVSSARSASGSHQLLPTRARHVEVLQASAAIEERLASHLLIRRMRAVWVRWLYERAVVRGVVSPPLPSSAPGRRMAGVVRVDRDTTWTEGGTASDPGRPRHRRYVSVEHPDWGRGFQTFLCLAEMPESWRFPYGNGEWLWHLDDQLGFGVDWVLRIQRIANQAARQRVLRAKRNLIGQLTEPGSDPAGPVTTLGAAAEAVEDQRARLEANPALPAFRATTIVAVAHENLRGLEERAGLVESVFRGAEFNFYRPTGAQIDCFRAMLPGPTTGSVVREYAQDLLPDGLASAMPFAGSPIGDPTGIAVGYSLDTQYRRRVFVDPTYGPRVLDRSGSMAVVGELGAGKSFFAKTLALATIGMGAQVVAVDRTERGEYRGLADVIDAESQVVEIHDHATVCLDPFAVFTEPEYRLRYALGFVSLLTATPPGSAAGAQCHRALQHVLNEQPHPRLGDVIPVLDDAGGSAVGVAEKLRALSEIPLGRLVFDPEREPVDLTADYVCFHLPGLTLPRPGTSRDEMLPEELIGQALLYLVTAFSRRVLFAHPDRFAALLLDEAHALAANPQGRALIGELIRDGRKHYAAVWALSQLPGDLTGGDGELDTLLGYRAVFRQSHQTAAAALEFCGTETRPDTLETITGLGTGECLLRDPRGRLGVIRITPPNDPKTAAAFSTTPHHNATAAQ